jgi:hypothetical protein
MVQEGYNKVRTFYVLMSRRGSTNESRRVVQRCTFQATQIQKVVSRCEQL